MTKGFAELGVRPALVAALAKLGIADPTPVQEAALPVLLEGKDAHLFASTGTGKTLAYLLPLFERLDPAQVGTQIMVVAPTHELAIQIHRVCTDLAQHGGLAVRACLLIGGTPVERQLEKLKKKPHIVVGSSGRIRDLIGMGKLKVHTVRCLVLDEADRLMGKENRASIEALVKTLPRRRQNVFAAATDSAESLEAMSALAPALVRVAAAEAPINPAIEHLYIICEDRKKADVVRKLWHAFQPDRSIVFVHRNERADVIWNKLAHHDVPVADLHAALDKFERAKAMEDFRTGRARVLIASDVAARGLDIKGVTHVFNLDVPTESKAYLHRAGRTGRAGQSGTAVTLVNEEELRLLRRYEKELGIALVPVVLREGRVERVEQPAP